MTSIVPVEVRAGRPLAPAQRPLWMSQRLHPAAPVQNMALLTHIDGPVDADRLGVAFETVVADSDALRTRIVELDGRARVMTNAKSQTRLVIDLDRADTGRWAADRVRQPLDMTVRGHDSVVIRHGDGTCSWYLALHHTITDATSSALVFAATAERYHRAGGSKPAKIGSYYRWVPGGAEQAGCDDPARRRRSQALDHWSSRSAPPPIDRLYRPRRRREPDAARVDVGIDADLTAAAESRLADDYRMLSDDLGWTALLTAATAVYLNRVAGAERLSVGVPVHNRSDPAARDLIGPIMEVFPVDVVVEPGDSFRTLHRRVAGSLLATLGRAVPGTAPTPDYQVVVNVIGRAAVGPFGPLPTTTRWIHSGAMDAGHLLRVQLTAYDPGDEHDQGGRSLVLDVNREVADGHHLTWAPGHFRTVLAAMVADPDRPVGVGLCGDDELAAIEAWEQGPTGPTAVPTVVAALSSGLAGSDRVALRDGTRSWTGDELWQLAARTATWLADRGAAPGQRIGIELARGAGAVVAIAATLMTGASFVPLDPTHPPARRRRLAERAACRLVIDELPDHRDLPAARADLPVAVTPDDEAYVLFTSGSSGEAKGVPVLHRGLGRYLRFAQDHYLGDFALHPERPLVVPLFTSLGFDLTITSLFLPLITGGELLTIEADGPAGLAALAAQRQVTWCKATPSHLEILCRLLPADHSLATIVVGGAAFGSGLARRLLDRNPDLVIFNEYGPTEAVVGCMIHRVDPETVAARPEVPIGRPAPGVTLRIVGADTQRLPLGSAGELCIAHDGLTAGYLTDPGGIEPGGIEPGDSDDGRFVILDGVRFYRSGDLVRLDDPTTAVYLGRIDDQVKVGGIRLEPTEVEDALADHPALDKAAVRLWSPRRTEPSARCIRCGLADSVPGVTLDGDGTCSTCHGYDRVAPQAEAWFGTVADLEAKGEAARAARTGRHDCLHLLSGGKDSTYALYRLVDLGFEPYALTLDNGFISTEAKANIARAVADLGIDHELATSDAMNAIFRDSLERHSNVCHGCYKTIYTLATTRAVELGAPLIVTGLSRGQLFETRLIPQQFAAGRFDPDAIDRAVIEARKAYHRLDDAPNRLLDTAVFASDEVFDRIEYLDFYRYVDVELAELLSYLDRRAPWVRPSDTGRSTNCLINAAGIHTHLTEQGFHNYAVPYAWDVRLGHKTRQEAIDELDDQLDQAEVEQMLAAVGYEPRPTQVLTAWVETVAGAEFPNPAELRAFLAPSLPAHAIPAAFVEIDQLPLTGNGKLDSAALPPPERTHRPGTGVELTPTTELEASLIEVWERILRVEPIGADDDFFALGGDSLAALEMMSTIADAVGADLGDDLAFANTTPRTLAAALEAGLASRHLPSRADGPAPLGPWPPERPPPLADGELAILYGQAERPHDVHYNVGRLYLVDGEVDGSRFGRALRQAAALHVPLRWSYGATRQLLSPGEAVHIEQPGGTVAVADLEAAARGFHRRPIDLEHGPLLRCRLQSLDDGTTAVLLVIHHVSGDAGSFDRLWATTDRILRGCTVEEPAVDYPSFTRWQLDRLADTDLGHFLSGDRPGPARLAVHPTSPDGPDGFVTRAATVGPDDLDRTVGTSGFATALAAVAATVRRYSNGDRVELGMITSTRNHQAAAPLVGYFLNTLPIDLDCALDQPISRLVAAAATAVTANLAHRTVPYGRIVAERRNRGHPRPEVEILVAYDRLEPLTLEGCRVEQHVLSNGTAVADATFFIEIRAGRVDLSLEYRGSVIDRDQAAAMLTDLDVMLAAAVARSTRPLGEVGLASSPSLLVGPSLEAPASVLPAIIANSERLGDQPAVRCDGASLSWAELGHRSLRLARRLREAGVSPGDRVVVCLPRSLDLVTAIVAVLRAGAAYVPVDPSYPSERIRLTVDRADALVAVVEPGRPLTGRDLTVDGPDATSAAPDDLDRAAGPDPAYVIFTSGSTGLPRGVPVGHRQLAASIEARLLIYPERPERFLMVSSPAFDSSIVGLIWPLARGGTVVLPSDGEVNDPDRLLSLFATEDISHTLMVPTLYQGLLQRAAAGDHDPGAWPARVIVAGESCPTSLAERHHQQCPGSALTNEYGPTETTVWATAHHCSAPRGPVPIGQPIPGTWLALVDEAARPVPTGVEGRLVIGGAGVVDGYLDDPVTTAERFVAGPAGLTFRTGDRAVLGDGTVHFLGRSDDQLNVGGVRAEPEDIERVLLGDPSVGAAVVVAVDPRPLTELLDALPTAVVATAMAEACTTGAPAAELAALLRVAPTARQQLVAHLEPAGTDPIRPDRLRSLAADGLPSTLRPARYEIHRRLPRTANGKLDRAGARRLALSRHRAAPRPQATGTGPAAGPGPEAAGVAEVFAAVLGVAGIAPDQSFFDLGGNSLSAMDLLLRLEARFGPTMTVSTLYDHPTPAATATWIAGRNGSARGRADVVQNRYLVPIQPQGTRPPIFGIHVLGDNSEFYRPLAARLGPDQPIWGLGLPSLLPDTSGPTDVAEVASCYATELERCSASGPVTLAAVSLGSVVAFELAHQLRRRGREVALLVLFDAAGPHAADHGLTGRERLRTHLGELTRFPVRYAADRCHNVAARSERRLEQVGLRLRRAVGLPLGDQLRVRQFVEANWRSQLAYRYQPYDGPIVVYKAADDPFTAHLVEHGLGWEPVATGPLTITPVPGGHLSMLAEPHVEHLARELGTAHRAANGNHGTASTGDGDGAVERVLLAALADGTVPLTIARMLPRLDRLDPGDRALVERCDRTMTALAEQALGHGRDAVTTLAASGVTARLDPVPDRLPHCSVSLRVSALSDGVPSRAAITALTATGYRVQERRSDSCTLILTNETTTRLRLAWPRNTAGTRAEAKSRSVSGDLGVFLGTPVGLAADIVALAEPTADDVLVDVGSGDGRVLIAAARRFGLSARGVEQDPELAELARARVAEAGLSRQIEIITDDGTEAEVGDATIVFLFLPPEVMVALLPDLLRRVPPGGRIIAHEQLAISWSVEPSASRFVAGPGGLTVAHLWRTGR